MLHSSKPSNSYLVGDILNKALEVERCHFQSESPLRAGALI